MLTSLRTVAPALFLLTSVLLGTDPSRKAAAPSWTPPDHAKVIGYRFRIPSDDAKEPVPSGFSLITKSGLDTKKLDTLQVKSAELTHAQVQQLMQAMSAGNITPPAACYDPHHIFVFYHAAGSPVGAVEVVSPAPASPPLRNSRSRSGTATISSASPASSTASASGSSPAPLPNMRLCSGRENQARRKVKSYMATPDSAWFSLRQRLAAE